MTGAPGLSPQAPARRTSKLVVAAALIGIAGVLAGLPVVAQPGSDESARSPLEAVASTDVRALAPERAADDVVDLPDDVEIVTPPSASLTVAERCHLDRATVTALTLAYVTQTGTLPSDPLVLQTTWLADGPDGWFDDWEFTVGDAGLTVTPASGGNCDLEAATTNS